MKRFLFLFLFSISLFAKAAEQPTFDIFPEVDLVSRYMWRGFSVAGPGVNAMATGEMAWNGKNALTLDAWGYNSFNESIKEIDLILAYKRQFSEKHVLQLGLGDYWYVNERDKGFFDYSNDSTLHALELFAVYTFSFNATNHLSIQWATQVYGCDKKPVNDGGGVEQAYTSYLEFQYGSVFAKRYNWHATLGFNPYDSPKHETDNFALINIGLGMGRKFEFGERTFLTPHVLFTMNPSSNDAYITLKLAFGF